MLEKLLTPEQAAEILSVSPKTVIAWIRQGKLKGVRAGRLWRIRGTDLVAYLERPEEVREDERAGPDTDTG